MVFAQTSSSEKDVVIVIDSSNQELLKNDSPNEIEKKGFLKSSFNTIKEIPSKTVNGSVEFIKNDFTPAAASFYIGSLFQVIRLILTNPETDVERLKNFFTNNILSVNAQVSFSFFIAGSKISNSFLDHISTRYGWLKNEKKIQELMTTLAVERSNSDPKFDLFGSAKLNKKKIEEWNKIRRKAESLTDGKITSVQLNKIKMYSGFAFGFLISTIYTDLSNDPDINYYARALISTPEEINEMIAEKGYTPLAAYQKAYDRWVTRGKIIDYIPHLLSSWTTIAIQSFVIPTTKNEISKITSKAISKQSFAVKRFVLKSIQFIKKLGSYIPQSRLLSSAAHAFMFLEINDPILHIYEPIYEKMVHGVEALNSLEKVQKLILRPQIPQNCIEYLKSTTSFDKNAFDKTSYDLLKRTFELNSQYSPYCDLEASYPNTLSKFHQNLNHWRNFWLKNVTSSLSSWSSYFESFSNHYKASNQFYAYLVSEINNTKSNNFENYPFYGIGTDQLNYKNVSTTVASTVAKVYFLLKKEINNSKITKSSSNVEASIIQLYKNMLYYLSVFDNQTPLAPSVKYEFERIDKLRISKEEKEQLKEKFKESYSAKAFETFNRAKIYNPELSDKNNNIASLGELKKILNYSENLKAGEMFIKSLETDDVINFKSISKSESLYGVYYRNLPEKYLISAACGPRYTFSGQKIDTGILSSSVFDKIPFWSTSFNPPRIVDTGSFNPCEEYSGINYYNTKPFYYNNNRYENLVYFIKENINAQFKGDNAVANLETFWKNTVTKEINTFLRSEESNFNKLLVTKLYPVLFSKEKFFSESNSSEGIYNSLQQEVKTSSPDNFLEIGIYNSYQQEIKIYLEILKKISPRFIADIKSAEMKLAFMLYIVSHPKDPTSWISYGKSFNLVFEEKLKKIIESTSDPYGRAYLFIDSYLKQVIFSDLFLKFSQQKETFNADEIDTVVRVNELLNECVNGLVQTFSYYKIFEYVDKK